MRGRRHGQRDDPRTARIEKAAVALRLAIAIVVGLIIFAVGYGSFRGLVRPRAGGAGPDPVPADPRVRVVWWCENCGAEVVVTTRGSSAPFKHCGEPMVRREEVLGQN